MSYELFQFISTQRAVTLVVVTHVLISLKTTEKLLIPSTLAKFTHGMDGLANMSFNMTVNNVQLRRKTLFVSIWNCIKNVTF